MTTVERERQIVGCATAHRRLLESLDGLTDAHANQPSLLPGWTVGHVLTHLARNADSHVRMLQGAQRGEVVEQYEGGAEGRERAIEQGAHRRARALVGDVSDSIARLEQTWSVMTEAAWAGSGLTVRGPMPASSMPHRRWIEVEVHHADLALGYTFADMPADFVGFEVRRLTSVWASRQPMGLTGLAPRALQLEPHDRLAWLAGRLHIDGLAPADVLV